eukprot:scaffold179084_cov15-Tisochrysis_lutea.AAC.1
MSASLQPTYGVSGQASGIPAVVTGELAGQPLVAVGAIELVGAAGGLRDLQGGAEHPGKGHFRHSPRISSKCSSAAGSQDICC